MSNSTPNTTRNRISIRAVIACAASLAAAVVALFEFELWWLPLPLAAVGVFLGLVSRKELQRDESLGGAGASAAGAIIGAIVIIFVMLPWVLIAIANLSTPTAIS